MSPPPPPAMVPPPPAPPKPSATTATSPDDTAGALFAEIANLGENGVRQGLKKATRGPVNEAVPDTAAPKQASVAPAAPKVTVAAEEAKCELNGKKWQIQHQHGNHAITVEANMKQTVYIYKCVDSLVKITGKVNAIVLDNCAKTACVFDEVMASVEIVNSKDIQIQCTVTAPSVNIDGSVAVTYYMSHDYKGNKIITAKSAAVNLIRPTADDDIVETPIPEQFLTTWKDGQWATEMVTHKD